MYLNRVGFYKIANFYEVTNCLIAVIFTSAIVNKAQLVFVVRRHRYIEKQRTVEIVSKEWKIPREDVNSNRIDFHSGECK